jgi:hypothetical protein
VTLHPTTRRITRAGALFVVVLASPFLANVATGELPPPPAIPGEEGTREELAAWELAQARNFPRAREAAEAVVRGNPSSFVGHYVLGFVFNFGEGIFA